MRHPFLFLEWVADWQNKKDKEDSPTRLHLVWGTLAGFETLPALWNGNAKGYAQINCFISNIDVSTTFFLQSSCWKYLINISLLKL
ncbi:hypothetical protein ASG21_02970 [Chryseobacterium sp. Leaf394]|nr:hypothetical protein ASG21_02970 [Chryseobacterium sp. Leaf394]